MTLPGTGRRHQPRYTREAHGRAGDARLHSPVFERNAPPILDVLRGYLSDARGTVMEIGAGTGQHAAAFARAFPALDWLATDPDETHLASIRAWGAPLPPLRIDAAGDWAALPEIRARLPLRGLYAGNVTHIAPWKVTEGILAGAGKALAAEGHLFLYGPFRDGEEFFGEGNRSFDAGLRADDAEWGLRDMARIDALARDHGLGNVRRHKMPANNHLLVYARP